MEINKLLEYSIESGASDLHLSVGSIPMVRINGTMKPLNMEPLSKDQMDSIIPQVMDEEQIIIEKRLIFQLSLRVKEDSALIFFSRSREQLEFSGQFLRQ